MITIKTFELHSLLNFSPINQLFLTEVSIPRHALFLLHIGFRIVTVIVAVYYPVHTDVSKCKLLQSNLQFKVKTISVRTFHCRFT